jgi:hypothetical protein
MADFDFSNSTNILIVVIFACGLAIPVTIFLVCASRGIFRALEVYYPQHAETFHKWHLHKIICFNYRSRCRHCMREVIQQRADAVLASRPSSALDNDQAGRRNRGINAHDLERALARAQEDIEMQPMTNGPLPRVPSPAFTT